MTDKVISTVLHVIESESSRAAAIQDLMKDDCEDEMQMDDLIKKNKISIKKEEDENT